MSEDREKKPSIFRAKAIEYKDLQKARQGSVVRFSPRSASLYFWAMISLAALFAIMVTRPLISSTIVWQGHLEPDSSGGVVLGASGVDRVEAPGDQITGTIDSHRHESVCFTLRELAWVREGATGEGSESSGSKTASTGWSVRAVPEFDVGCPGPGRDSAASQAVMLKAPGPRIRFVDIVLDTRGSR